MRTRAPLVIGCAAALVGTAAAVFYAQAGLTLSHFDARAHLVVSRRILDSLSPGWQQIGAVWLPLPHLLNMVPIQIDAWYRSGASAVAISIASTGVAAWALARIIQLFTGSVTGGLVGAALLVANPNWLYIQSTPMTEPLLLATALLAIAFTAEWVESGAAEWPAAAGLALTATCMTRYEGWLIAGSAIALAAAVLVRRGASVGEAIKAALKLGTYPAIAIAIFSANSRWTIGTWFIPRDFFVPENDALGRPALAWEQVREAALRLSGSAAIWSGYAGAALTAVAFVRSRQRAGLVLLLALFACALLPWYAYLQGHPLRVRYGLLLVAACGVLAGAGVGLLWRPLRLVAGAAIVAATLSQASPLDRRALLIVESQRDAESIAGRAAVTRYLLEHYDRDHDGPIMMSMGSLAHYMHELGRAGFDIHSFLHEGNGQAWQYAVLGPKGYVKWVALEERAEGGDALFQAWQRDERYLDGFERVAEGGGVALYRRRSTPNDQLPTPKPPE
jgi:hypothetical protein